MRSRSFPLALLAAASLAACGSPDLTLPAARSPGAPAANHTGPICVQFNVPAFGTLYGSSVGTVPGTTLWIEQVVKVSVLKFQPTATTSAYNVLRIENAPAAFTLASGQTGHANNINVGFDFSGLTFVPNTIKFHYLDLGGVENLSINGSPNWIGQITAPPAAINGVGVASSFVAVPGGTQGTVTLTSAVKRFSVGGQELWLDTVCAYP